METQSLTQKIAGRKLKYYSVPSEPRKKEQRPKEFFYIGTDKKIISLLLANFESGFCSEDLSKGAQIIEMLISRQISLPDVIVIQDGFEPGDLNNFFFTLHLKIQAIPVIIEASHTAPSVMQQFRQIGFIDDVFVIDESSMGQFIKKVNFLKKIRRSETSTSLLAELNRYDEGSSVKNISKKVFDIVVASLALIILSPVFLLIALIIKLESRGPVLYCSPRVGRGYKVFKFYKFRTMEVGADSKVHDLYHLNQYNTECDKKGPMFFKVTKDPRVTKVGNFLRNTSLDELPQFFNVLKGDMSIVGNRPLPLYEAETLTTDEWAKRFLAPAGITGLWQIRKKANKNMSIEERINLDIDYADKHNFAYDLWILANTPNALIQKEENKENI